MRSSLCLFECSCYSLNTYLVCVCVCFWGCVCVIEFICVCVIVFVYVYVLWLYVCIVYMNICVFKMILILFTKHQFYTWLQWIYIFVNSEKCVLSSIYIYKRNSAQKSASNFDRRFPTIKRCKKKHLIMELDDRIPLLVFPNS